MNLAADVQVSEHFSVELPVLWCPWYVSSEHAIKTFTIQPEARYWLSKPGKGHFFGVHGFGGEYNIAKVKLPFGLAKNGKDYRYDGSYVGGGVSYGYQWMLARKWSLEATVGVGYVRFNYDKYPCYDCGQRLESGNKNYFGPTKVGINLIFVIN